MRTPATAMERPLMAPSTSPIWRALPVSYTHLNVAVCALVALCQLLDLFTGRELPRWVKQLKFWSTSCLTMTFLTVVFILAPMYQDGNGWYIMLFTGSMLYHHFLNPVVAMVSFLLFEREPRLPLASVPLALVPTIVYGVYDLWGLSLIHIWYGAAASVWRWWIPS